MEPNLTDTTRLQQLYSRRVDQRGAADDMSHASLEAILAVVQREGPDDERLATLEHVMSCGTCHREYEWLTAVNESALEAEGRPRGARWSWARMAPLATAATLLLAVGAGLLLKDQLRRGQEPERGGGAGDIALAAPADGATLGGPLAFVWHPLPQATRYVLELQRRDGTVAYSDTTSDTTATIVEAGRLLPTGEYRWWVRETTDGAEPRSSALRKLRLSGR